MRTWKLAEGTDKKCYPESTENKVRLL